MSFTLFDATVPNFLQTLSALGGILDKGLQHGLAHGLTPDKLVETKLAPDMLPLRFQLLSAVHHSRGAIEGVQKGLFEPPARRPETTYTDLQTLVKDAHTFLAKLTPETVNGLAGRDIVFKLGERQMPFRAEDFLMSFSKPNFYFHCTTAYDLLRMVGVPLGKRDYLGKMRMKS
jgi:uncharacterized protein